MTPEDMDQLMAQMQACVKDLNTKITKQQKDLSAAVKQLSLGKPGEQAFDKLQELSDQVSGLDTKMETYENVETGVDFVPFLDKGRKAKQLAKAL